VTATGGNANFLAAPDGKVSVGGNTTIAGALTIPRADEVILTGNVIASNVVIGDTNVRTINFGANLDATAGDILLIGNHGPVSVAGTLKTVASLNIPSGTAITHSRLVETSPRLRAISPSPPAAT
jgi:hypothetical protein